MNWQDPLPWLNVLISNHASTSGSVSNLLGKVEKINNNGTRWTRRSVELIWTVTGTRHEVQYHAQCLNDTVISHTTIEERGQSSEERGQSRIVDSLTLTERRKNVKNPLCRPTPTNFPPPIQAAYARKMKITPPICQQSLTDPFLQIGIFTD